MEALAVKSKELLVRRGAGGRSETFRAEKIEDGERRASCNDLGMNDSGWNIVAARVVAKLRICRCGAELIPIKSEGGLLGCKSGTIIGQACEDHELRFDPNYGKLIV